MHRALPPPFSLSQRTLQSPREQPDLRKSSAPTAIFKLTAHCHADLETREHFQPPPACPRASPSRRIRHLLALRPPTPPTPAPVRSASSAQAWNVNTLGWHMFFRNCFQVSALRRASTAPRTQSGLFQCRQQKPSPVLCAIPCSQLLEAFSRFRNWHLLKLPRLHFRTPPEYKFLPRPALYYIANYAKTSLPVDPPTKDFPLLIIHAPNAPEYTPAPVHVNMCIHGSRPQSSIHGTCAVRYEGHCTPPGTKHVRPPPSVDSAAAAIHGRPGTGRTRGKTGSVRGATAPMPAETGRSARLMTSMMTRRLLVLGLCTCTAHVLLRRV